MRSARLIDIDANFKYTILITPIWKLDFVKIFIFQYRYWIFLIHFFFNLDFVCIFQSSIEQQQKLYKNQRIYIYEKGIKLKLKIVLNKIQTKYFGRQAVLVLKLTSRVLSIFFFIFFDKFSSYINFFKSLFENKTFDTNLSLLCIYFNFSHVIRLSQLILKFSKFDSFKMHF